MIKSTNHVRAHVKLECVTCGMKTSADGDTMDEAESNLKPWRDQHDLCVPEPHDLEIICWTCTNKVSPYRSTPIHCQLTDSRYDKELTDRFQAVGSTLLKAEFEKGKVTGAMYERKYWMNLIASHLGKSFHTLSVEIGADAAMARLMTVR